VRYSVCFGLPSASYQNAVTLAAFLPILRSGRRPSRAARRFRTARVFAAVGLVAGLRVWACFSSIRVPRVAQPRGADARLSSVRRCCQCRFRHRFSAAFLPTPARNRITGNVEDDNSGRTPLGALSGLSRRSGDTIALPSGRRGPDRHVSDPLRRREMGELANQPVSRRARRTRSASPRAACWRTPPRPAS
jgi:hypothetical protein